MSSGLDISPFVNRRHYLSASTVIAELAQIDSLPGSNIESAVSDRNAKADSEKWTPRFKKERYAWLLFIDLLHAKVKNKKAYSEDQK